MDRASLAGLLLGLLAILGGQALEGGHLASLVQPTALLIVVGGTLGAVMLQTPTNVFRRGLSMGAWVFRPPVIDFNRLIGQISNWSHVSRREGLLALEGFVGPIKDSFTRNALQMLVDGIEPERMREALDIQIVSYEEEMRLSAKIWESAGGYSPTIGILGAVMGLIHVMENLTDPAKLGAGIAVAFVATIYGVGLANLLYLPMSGKIKAHIGRMVIYREMLVDGLVGIANGDNPRLIENRLKGYLV